MQTALMNGDAETGVSVMRMAEKLDAGDVMLQKKAALLPEDDAQTLAEKLSILGAEALLESLRELAEGRAIFIPQDEKNVTATKKIKKEDGRVDWKQPAALIHNKIRAMAGWPGTFSFYEKKRLIVIKAEIKKNEGLGAVPGTILKASAAEGIWVATRDHPLALQWLQAEGRKAMSAADFLKGFSMAVGRVFE
jgi:methionyl-tRNA formyltransferase